MRIDKVELGALKCLCQKCTKDFLTCGECNTTTGDGFRIQECGGCIILCSKCLAALRSKIDALTILIQTGADTK